MKINKANKNSLIVEKSKDGHIPIDGISNEKYCYLLYVILFVDVIYFMVFDRGLFDRDIGLYFGSLLLVYLPSTIFAMMIVYVCFKHWSALDDYLKLYPIIAVFLFVLYRINYFEVSSHINFITGVHPDNFSFYIEFLAFIGAYSYLSFLLSIAFFLYSLRLIFIRAITKVSLVNRISFSLIMIIPILSTWPPIFLSNNAIDGIIHDNTAGVFGKTNCLGYEDNSFYLSVPNGHVLKHSGTDNTYSMSLCRIK